MALRTVTVKAEERQGPEDENIYVLYQDTFVFGGIKGMDHYNKLLVDGYINPVESWSRDSVEYARWLTHTLIWQR